MTKPASLILLVLRDHYMDIYHRGAPCCAKKCNICYSEGGLSVGVSVVVVGVVQSLQVVSGVDLLLNSCCLVPVLADLQTVSGAGMAGVANMLTGQWGSLLCTAEQGQGFFSVCSAMFRMYRKLCLSTVFGVCTAYALQYILYIIPRPGYLYRETISECSTCTGVYLCD